MKIFIFQEVKLLTDNFHSNGGLVIVAKDLESALNLAKNYDGGYTWQDDKNPIKLNEEEIKNVISYDLVGEHEEKLFIFPDAGCC